VTSASQDGEPTSLIKTKLHRPRVSDDLVPRPHLVERLNEGLDHKFALISAPAGYGKTTLLCQWPFGVQGFMSFFPNQHNWVACTWRSSFRSTHEKCSKRNHAIETIKKESLKTDRRKEHD
jgi:hypothetical protein